MPLIIHFTRRYWPLGGGVETHLHHVNRELKKKLPIGSRIVVITLQSEANQPLTETHEGVEIIRLPVSDEAASSWWQKTKYKLRFWTELGKQLSLIKQADALFIHDVFWWLVPYVPFLNRLKATMLFHGYEGNEAPKFNQRLWHQVASWWAHANICVGDFHRPWYGVKPTHVIYGGVEAADSARSNKSSISSTLRIVFVGRLSADNGIEEYVQAIKALTDQKVSVKLDVFGQGPLEKELQQYIQQHQLPVKLQGFKPNANALLFKYDVVYTSRYLGILEGLAAERPIVAQYNNEIKHDYLKLAPFAPWISIVQTPAEIAASTLKPRAISQPAKTWVRNQTWSKVADVYVGLMPR